MTDFTTSGGVRLYYEDSGAGAPVLCLAGLTRNCRDFDFLAPHLNGYRMIAMDYRGRGLSDRAPDYASYNVLHESQDVIELLDHLHIRRAAVIGTSRGGLIAMTLAATHPDRLHGVVLNDVGPEIDTEGLARIAAYVGLPPAAADLDAAAAGMAALMAPGFPGVDAARWRQAAGAIYAETGAGLALRYDPRLRDALNDQLAAGPPDDLWPLFDAMAGLPLGVIRGANSDILTAATLDAMAARHPGLISATVPDRGHAPFLDEPQSLDVIRQILEAR